jgi:hypothetical protein
MMRRRKKKEEGEKMTDLNSDVTAFHVLCDKMKPLL